MSKIRHNCEDYRYTAEKYDIPEDSKLGKPYLTTWCSLCGKILRQIDKQTILNE